MFSYVDFCGSIEREILKKIPASLEALTVSRSALNKMLTLGPNLVASALSLKFIDFYDNALSDLKE